MTKTTSFPLVWIVSTLLGGGLAHAKDDADGRPLKLETFDSIVERNDRSVQACGKTLGRGGTRAVTLRIVIDERGQVTGADPTSASREGECLSKVVRTMHFPATGVVSKLEYPFLLLPRR